MADSIARTKGWQAKRIQTDSFSLRSYVPIRHEESEELTIYIEGDGLAWLGESDPSGDPTPLNPLALRLALAQPDGNAAYLARPCQYADKENTNCSIRYWTGKRFAPEVIDACDFAIGTLKSHFGAKKLTLIGYSGGGAVAALIAARRSDVESLITIAGNLDHYSWTTFHRISPLCGSLNPADEIQALGKLKQLHLAGEKDRVIPPELVENFANLFPGNSKPLVRIEPGFDHRCCWVEKWPEIWQLRPDFLPRR